MRRTAPCWRTRSPRRGRRRSGSRRISSPQRRRPTERRIDASPPFMTERSLEIKNKLGLHARAAAKLVHTSARFKSNIKIRKGEEEVDGKSILGILLLAAGRGSVITVRAEGEDEAEAIDASEKLIDTKSDESERI